MLQSAQFGRILEPGLRKIFDNTYQEVPEQYSQVFNVQTSTKAIETDLRMAGFGLWEKKDSAGSIQYQDTPNPQALQYIHEEFSSGFTVERKLLDDEMYNTIGKRTASLARSARATIETRAAEVINNSFTVNGFDGAPLISATHKRLDGGYFSNQLGISVDVASGAQTSGTTGSPVYGGVANGQLSDRNLKAALIQARKQVDDKGLLIQVQPKILVVPPELEYIAKTLVGGDNVSANGTGSGFTTDINAIKSRLRVVVLDYLTSSSAWWIIDPTVAELNFFWRKRLEFANERDFNTHQQKYSGYMRFSVGYSDFRGILGSLGTGAA